MKLANSSALAGVPLGNSHDLIQAVHAEPVAKGAGPLVVARLLSGGGDDDLYDLAGRRACSESVANGLRYVALGCGDSRIDRSLLRRLATVPRYLACPAASCATRRC